MDQYKPAVEVCRKLGRLLRGPSESKRADWIEKILALAEEARTAVAKAKGDAK